MTEPEASGIEAAYYSHVQKLFEKLIGNLVTGQSEEDAVGQFKTGLAIAKRAKELADQVIKSV